MNISTLIPKINISFKKGHTKKQPTTEEFIERGFASQNKKNRYFIY